MYATQSLTARITYYNEAAAALWGRRPDLGESEFLGLTKLIRPDGTTAPYEEWPTAIALREGRTIRAAAVVAEEFDGARVPFYSVIQFRNSTDRGVSQAL